MSMSSRERLLTALNCKNPDYAPCSYLYFDALRNHSRDDIEFAKKQLELGLDPVLNIDSRPINGPTDHKEIRGMPVRIHPEVKVKEWVEKDIDGAYPIIHKQYITPEGILKVLVKQDNKWPYGNHVPILDDYLSSRSKKFLIRTEDDLKKLKYILTPPSKSDIEEFKEKVNEGKRFAKKNGVLLGIKDTIGGIEISAWLVGLEYMFYQFKDNPDFVEEFISFISSWNRKRLEIYLDLGIELVVRRAWYEGGNFLSPFNFKKFILPSLKNEVNLCHQVGVKFGYMMSLGSLPLIDLLMDAKIDALIGVDPVMDHRMDLKTLKEKVNGKMCLWGGINQTLTIEMGSEDEIRNSLRRAIDILGKDGGFILSPVDNVLFESEEIWRKTMMFIRIWKEFRSKK